MRSAAFVLVIVALLAGQSGIGLAENSAAPKIRVLTYNVGLLRDPLFGEYDAVGKVTERAPLVPLALAQFARDLAPDIINLQEVWEEQHAAAIRNALVPLGYTVVRPRLTFWQTPNIYGAGLLVAIRNATFDFLRADFHLFPSEIRGGMEVIAKKGFAFFQLYHRAKNATVILGVTHMQALDVDRDGKTTHVGKAKAHAAQSEMINAGAYYYSQGYRLPVILAGDLNVGPRIGRDLYEKLVEVPYTKTKRVADAFGKIIPQTWDSQNPLIQAGAYPDDPSDLIDHVLVRDGVAHVWRFQSASVVFKETTKAGVPLSDHYGLLVDLELTKWKARGR